MADPASVQDPPAPPRRRRHKAWKIVALTVVVVLCLVVAAGAVVYIRLDRNIATFDPHGIAKHRPPPTVAGQNILLIGSDSRSGADRALGGAGDAVGRSDTTLFMHVYEGGTRAVAVSIPRDALVRIPPCLLPDHTWSAAQPRATFNAAFSVGGTRTGNPACTVNTVEALTHMRVDHTVVVDFAGFAAMSDIVGGVPVCLPHAVYQGDLNPNLGARGKLLFRKGVQQVSGARALDYVRIRHGIGDGSDVGRMQRQQAFLSSVIAKVRAQGLTPSHILPLAEAATKHLTVDAGLATPRKLAAFALGLRHLPPANIEFLTTPWRYAGARVALVHPDVDRLWAALRADQPLTAGGRPAAHRPTVAELLATVSGPVEVLDRTGRPAPARQTTKALRAAGVRVSRVSRVTVAGSAQRRTVVEFGPGRTASARALASAFDHPRMRPVTAPVLRVVLGTRHTMPAPGSIARLPSVALPGSVTDGIRSADANPCKGITYGPDTTG